MLWHLTFDMSGSPKTAKQALGCRSMEGLGLVRFWSGRGQAKVKDFDRPPCAWLADMQVPRIEVRGGATEIDFRLDRRFRSDARIDLRVTMDMAFARVVGSAEDFQPLCPHQGFEQS